MLTWIVYVLYLFAGHVSDEPLACTYKNGGRIGCAYYEDGSACGICPLEYTAQDENGHEITISATVSASASAKLNNIGLTVGAEASSSHTVTGKKILGVTVGDDDVPGKTGTICIRYQITKFTLRKWKKEYECRLLSFPLPQLGRLVTHFRWVSTDETEDHEIRTGYCDERKLVPCTTKSPTVSFVAFSLYLIYLLELTSHNCHFSHYCFRFPLFVTIFI